MVSVLITNKDYGKYLKQCVESIRGQTVPPDEILICDDGSGKKDIALIHKLGLKGIFNAKSKGVAWCRNELVFEAKSNLCLFVDADDILELDYIEKQLATLKAHPQSDIIYSDWQEFGDEVKKVVVNERARFDTLYQGNYISISSLFRKSMYLEMSGQQELDYFEDWDFWLRCLHSGYQATKAKGTMLWYRIHKGSRNQTDEHSKRSKVLDYIRGQYEEIK